MRVLLPPSESKRPDGGNAIFTPESLTFRASLGETRARVREAVETVSGDADRARTILKLGVKSADERLHNLRLADAHGIPAIERYVGVLYDEISLETLTDEAREWISEHVLIQSALFGLIHAGDEIPAYRLSASTKLTDELGMTLKRLWNTTFSTFPWPDTFLLDLRSSDYAALAPLPSDATSATLDIVQRDADGELRALNHFNKRAKGDLIARLASSRPKIETIQDLIEWGTASGLEIVPTEDDCTVRLVTALGATVSR